MSLQDLKNVKLKKAVVEKKENTLSKAPVNVVQHEAELNRRMLQADLDAWYDELKDVTYTSVFLPLSQDEAQAMLSVYEAREKGLEPEPADSKLLDHLEGRIAVKMKELGSSAVFAKLSSRSPKDAKNRIPVKYRILEELLTEKKKTGNGRSLTPNEILGAIFQAHISSFKLKSAKEVLETLMSSDRVVTDEIPLVLEHKATVWKEHIVLREWVDIPIKFEFRGFVFGDRLTALCQYYDEVLYPDLVSNKDTILKLILDFLESVKGRVPITPKEYVMDFLVDLDKKIVRVVEINPFGLPDGMGTGTVMFDLKTPHDVDILFGRAPFEFRVETKELTKEKYAGMLSPEFKKIVQKFE